MSLSILSLKTERQWRSSTTLSSKQFAVLVKWFSVAYEQEHGVSLETAQINLSKEFIFSTYPDFLFFVLFSLKNPTTFDVNGLIFGISQSAAESNFKRGLAVLELALSITNNLPRQNFKDIADFKNYLKEHKILKIDVTEITVQRPRNKEKQVERYSGKKNAILVKH
jgi:hypothetical protein